MTGPPERAVTQPTFREAAKQARAFEAGGRVSVHNEFNFLITVLHSERDAEQIRRLLAAPNAVPVWTHSGKLKGIRLQSHGDDRSHAGERHGRSTLTTERSRGGDGQYIGTDKNVQHKATCSTWGDLAVKVRPANDSQPKAHR